MSMRHTLRVAEVSARYVFHGWQWSVDEVTGGLAADGVARQGDVVHLVEVELTMKTHQRYARLFEARARRLERGPAQRMVYFCDRRTAPLLGKYVATKVFPGDRDRFVVLRAFDDAGEWVAVDDLVWPAVSSRAAAPRQ